MSFVNFLNIMKAKQSVNVTIKCDDNSFLFRTGNNLYFLALPTR